VGVAAKLAVAESAPVITGLLLVVARLVHLHLPDTLACLASQPAPHGAHAHLALAPGEGFVWDYRHVARDSLCQTQHMVLVRRSQTMFPRGAQRSSAQCRLQLWLC
jgi:hypothetical protein